jgi:hypothetical protein
MVPCDARGRDLPQALRFLKLLLPLSLVESLLCLG